MLVGSDSSHWSQSPREYLLDLNENTNIVNIEVGESVAQKVHVLKYHTTIVNLQFLYNYIPIWTWYHVVTLINKRLNEDLCCAMTIFNPYQTHRS